MTMDLYMCVSYSIIVCKYFRFSELKFPMGAVTDDNGFVYVCELFNHHVLVF